MAGFTVKAQFMGVADKLDLWGLRVVQNSTKVSGTVKLPLTG